jgi:hypothetical protein
MMGMNKKAHICLLVALLISSNGCMTYSAVQEGKGKWNVVTGHKPSEPHPACYALVPLTVPLDVATSPIQLIYYIALSASPE